MNRGKVKFITLGCRVNQYETQAMKESLLRDGFEQAGKDNRLDSEPVDLVVINTCTVTSEADREGRYWMRRARKMYPRAQVVVTGCSVTRDRREVEALPEVDLVIENYQKNEVSELVSLGCGIPEIQDLVQREKRIRYAPLVISRSEGFGRAFVKIQDGCNHACTFCKVVLARGRSRSRPLSDIIEEVRRLRDAGYKEVVFAGIQLGAYGADLNDGTRKTAPWLQDVLYESSKIDGIERLRLSSIEPTDVQDELIAAMKSISKCVPHLHIPLQSGDDEILKRMNRRYSRTFYEELISRLKEGFQDFALSLDVMAGFPGETDEQYHHTVDLLTAVVPVKTHVFPYSPRAGTKAAQWRNLAGSVVRNRAQELRAVGEELAHQYRKRFLGRKVLVLIESSRIASHGDTILQGLTPHFMKVSLKGPQNAVGEILPVFLETIAGDVTQGRQEIPNEIS